MHHPWKHSRLDGLWATWSSWRYPWSWRGVGLDDLKRYLPTQSILRFYGTVMAMSTHQKTTQCQGPLLRLAHVEILSWTCNSRATYLQRRDAMAAEAPMYPMTQPDFYVRGTAHGDARSPHFSSCGLHTRSHSFPRTRPGVNNPTLNSETLSRL